MEWPRNVMRIHVRSSEHLATSRSSLKQEWLWRIVRTPVVASYADRTQLVRSYPGQPQYSSSHSSYHVSGPEARACGSRYDSRKLAVHQTTLCNIEVLRSR